MYHIWPPIAKNDFADPKGRRTGIRRQNGDGRLDLALPSSAASAARGRGKPLREFRLTLAKPASAPALRQANAEALLQRRQPDPGDQRGEAGDEAMKTLRFTASAIRVARPRPRPPAGKLCLQVRRAIRRAATKRSARLGSTARSPRTSRAACARPVTASVAQRLVKPWRPPSRRGLQLAGRREVSLGDERPSAAPHDDRLGVLARDFHAGERASKRVFSPSLRSLHPIRSSAAQ